MSTSILHAVNIHNYYSSVIPIESKIALKHKLDNNITITAQGTPLIFYRKKYCDIYFERSGGGGGA